MIKIKPLTLAFLLCLIADLSYSQNYYKEANKEFDSDKFRQAIELYTKAIINKQEIAKSYMMRGGSKIFIGQFEEARIDLESSKKLAPAHPRLYYFYGKYYYLTDNFDLAITSYSKCIDLDPRNADAYMERADAKAFKKDIQGALTDANKAISIDSTKDIFFIDRGCFRLELKQFEEAFKDFNRALKIKPSQRGYANRGEAWAITDQHQKAIEDFTKSLEFDPKAGEILYYRGKSYKALGKKEEAYADLRMSSGLGFTKSNDELKELGYTPNFYEEGRKEYQASNFNKAIELFTLAILNDQELAKSLKLRGASKIFLDQYDDAFADLESSRQIDSTDPHLYFHLGKYYRLTGKHELAISNYTRALAADSTDADSWYERSGAKANNNDLTGALADLNKAISIDSTFDDFFLYRGYIKILLKQYSEAVKDFTAALKIQPTQKAYANRGWAWSFLNEHQKAIEDYTQSLAINPQDGEVYCYRGKSYKALGKRTEACADLKKSSELGYVQSDAVLKELKCD